MAAVSFLFFGYTASLTRSYTLDKQKTKVTVTGTSNLHDWETSVTNFDGNLSVLMDENSSITGISLLNVNFYSKSFSSGKSIMDSKTTEALKAGTYPVINFKLSSITDKKTVNKIEQFTALGKLTIAGVTKDVSLSAFAAIGANGEVYFQGTKEIDMTEYGVDPPTALLGTLTTGKKVTVTYKLFFM
jgi:polyisoprenoid-binding protein YceI